MCTREKIIAVDFDGCLCENAWPDIGEAKQDVIDALLLRQKQGAKIILWTCRVGERLDDAVRWCAERGLSFDTINENLPSIIATFGNDCRKVFADEYWDDKACNPEIQDVSIPSTPNQTNIADMRTICDIPINPKTLRDMKCELLAQPYEFIEGKRVVPTRIASIHANVFLAFLELAGDIYSGLDWRKKGRIVVEYDPQEKKFQVATFQEASDLDIDPSREEVPRFLLRRECM